VSSYACDPRFGSETVVRQGATHICPQCLHPGFSDLASRVDEYVRNHGFKVEMAGFVIAEAAPRGNVTSADYDAQGNCARISFKAKEGATLARAYKYAHDAFGQLTAITHAPDANGHMLALTDAEGHVVKRYDYGDFGAPMFFDAAGALQAGSAVGNDVLAAGLRWDAETGLYAREVGNPLYKGKGPGVNPLYGEKSVEGNNPLYEPGTGGGSPMYDPMTGRMLSRSGSGRGRREPCA
jgi:hypothetical protein